MSKAALWSGLTAGSIFTGPLSAPFTANEAQAAAAQDAAKAQNKAQAQQQQMMAARQNLATGTANAEIAQPPSTSPLRRARNVLTTFQQSRPGVLG